MSSSGALNSVTNICHMCFIRFLSPSLSSPLLLPKGRLVEGAECFVSVVDFYSFLSPRAALFFCEIRQAEDTEGKVMAAWAATSTQGSCPCSLGVSSLTDDFILL